MKKPNRSYLAPFKDERIAMAGVISNERSKYNKRGRSTNRDYGHVYRKYVIKQMVIAGVKINRGDHMCLSIKSNGRRPVIGDLIMFTGVVKAYAKSNGKPRYGVTWIREFKIV